MTNVTAHEPRVMRTREAAQVLGLHVDTLRRAAASGTVPVVRLNERGWLRFRVTDIERIAGERR